jgi:hypothetical protein
MEGSELKVFCTDRKSHSGQAFYCAGVDMGGMVIDIDERSRQEAKNWRV